MTFGAPVTKETDMQDQAQQISTTGNGSRKKKALKVAGAAFAVLGIAIYIYLIYKLTHISTDDAFIDGHKYTVSARVAGNVSKVYVEDNEPVEEGALLLELDPATYEVEQALALAELEAARSATLQLEAKIKAERATLELKKASSWLAESNLKRARSLRKNGTITEEKYDAAIAAGRIAAADERAAEEKLKEAETDLSTHASVIKRAEAGLRAAELRLGYTRVLAPGRGLVTRKSVEPGNWVNPGQALMAITDLDDIWITANYKETQLKKVIPGQRVRFTVDAYPGTKFTGKVESIMSGTGAVFSLFPPENATGNYVKVVQRIPLRISIDKGQMGGQVLRLGMSVEPTILIE